MIYTYCTNNKTQLLPNVYAVDVVLDGNNPRHSEMISEYITTIEADLCEGLSDPNALSKSGCPEMVVIENDAVRFKLEPDKLPEEKIICMNMLSTVVDALSQQGHVTSVLDSDNNPIKMDCDRVSISNMEILLTLMKIGNQPTSIVRDYNNGFHVLTIEQLETLRIDLLQNGMMAYQIKWGLEMQINGASTMAELDAIKQTIPQLKQE